MSPRILLLGGHGKVSMLMTPKLLSRSWDVISVVRNPDHKAEILQLGKGKELEGKGKLEVLVSSLEDVKSPEDAKRVLDQTKPDWVVWSAGAGGKGGPSRTNAIDKEACIHFIRSSVSDSSITKFLLVSSLLIRRERAPWYDDDDWAMVKKTTEVVMPAYYKAKLAADEALVVLGNERVENEKKQGSKKEEFTYISLRPGTLTDEAESGRVSLGKTKARGGVPRGDVAEVGVRLLAKEGAIGWYDLLAGDDEVGAAVETLVKEGVNSIEGEDLEAMKREVKL